MWTIFLTFALVLALVPRGKGYIGYGVHRLQLWPAESLRSTSETFIPFTSTFRPQKPAPSLNIDSTKSSVGLSEKLPWQTSINPVKELSYMNFFSHQLSVIEKLGLRQQELDDSLACKHSTVKPARIGNLCFEGGKFRKVRFTYFDAGESVQVFNTLWYPKYEYDLPLLGVDLISLGKNRILNVIDCQPLHPTAEYAEKHINFLSDIRRKYPDLHGQLSGKIYDDTSFFSSNMLFGRFVDESKLQSVVFPAFKDYLEAYLAHADSCQPDFSPDSIAVVQKRQAAYDSYSAQKDPAVGLFDAYFGKDWSNTFVHDYLFTLSGNVQHANVHNFKVDAGSGTVNIGSTSSMPAPK